MSPISDTTIMASAGAQCHHVDHVSTQLPYALTVGGCCVAAYLEEARRAGATSACCTLTSAARDAQNARELGAALASLGLEPMVIPGAVEGSLTFLGVAQDFVGRRILVADNGGAVRWRGKDLFVSRMEPEVWHRLTACAEENGDYFVVCGLENAYLRPCDRCYDAVYRNFYNRIAYVSDLYTINAAVDKFTIYLPQDNAQEVYEKVYGPRFGQELAVAVSGKCWIDVTNPGVTKGKAVERLSRLLDIPSGAMMAFGDTYNDIEMLEAVGYGFLMENGSPELRSRVPYLAPPNTEYGVARVLQQVLRQKGCVCPADFTKAH